VRILDPDLLSAQADNFRYPLTKFVVYDSLLRWSLQPGAAGVENQLTLGDQPAALLDADIHNGTIRLCYIALTTPPNTYAVNFLSYNGETFSTLTTAVTRGARPSLYQGNLFYLSGDVNEVVRYTHGSGSTVISSKLTSGWDNEQHAISAVSADEFYHAYLAPSATAAALHNLRLEYINGSDDPSRMHYNIQVAQDYAAAAITWFDAVRLTDGTDVIVLNADPQGSPVIVLRQNGVFSEPHDLIPIDLVDNYSYLRIGWLSYYDGTIYATGELGRRGSTGNNPQSMAVVLRSSDGIHWSLDRWRYLGQTPLRSPLLLDGTYVYRINLPNVYRAPATPLFGLDLETADENIHICFDVDDDIMGYDLAMANDRQAGGMNVKLANDDMRYSASTSLTYIRPGYMLRLFAGYRTEEEDLYTDLGWYGIDRVAAVNGPSVREYNLSCREWNGRCMEDNRFDQDWQWVSPTRHYDPCAQPNYLYSIEGDTVRHIEPGPLLRTEDVDPYEDASNLKVHASSRDVSVLVSSTPFEVEGVFVSASFSVDGAYRTEEQDRVNIIWRLGFNEYGVGYDIYEKRLGTGAGAALIKNDDTYVTAFVDVKTQQLVLLQVIDGDWREIGLHDLSDYINPIYVDDLWGSYLIETWIETRGNTLRYGVVLTMSGYEWVEPVGPYSVLLSVIEEYDYFPNEIVALEYSAELERCGENRTGIVVGHANPYIRLALNSGDDVQDSNFAGRALSEFNNGDSIMDAEELGHAPYYTETGDYAWELFRDNRGGFVYLEGRADSPALCYTNSTYGGSNVTTSPRGDFCTGLWEILAVDTDTNQIIVEVNPADNYPLGETGDYWLTTLAPSDDWQYAGFWFMDGDLVGKWLYIESIDAGDAGRVAFTLRTEEDTPELIPGVGDSIIYAPGAYLMTYGVRRYAGSVRLFYNREPVGVRINSFIASEMTHEKSIRWTLDDIVAKSGVLTQLGATSGGERDYSIQETFDADGKSVISDIDLKDFDLIVELSEPIADANTFTFNFGRWAGVNDGARVIIERDGDDLTFSLVSQLDDVITEHFERTLESLWTDAPTGAKTLRFVKRHNFITVWMEGALVLSYPFRKRQADTVFSSDLMKYGEVSITFDQEGVTYTVTQEELWMPIDGIISGQGSNVIQALQQVIRDAHIKILSDQTLAVRIGLFDNRDDSGVLPDVAYVEQGELTDALPSHVRVTGEEIGEYFDHATMAEYGVVFLPRTVESLGEYEAHVEAQRMVKDSLGYNEGKVVYAGAQLQLEPEDLLELDVTTPEGLVIQGVYIIDSIQLTHMRPAMEMSLRLRKYVV
jgi:hypothetical protein